MNPLLQGLIPLVKKETEDCMQLHPLHYGSVWKHIEDSFNMALESGDMELSKVMLLHDVGKPSVKEISKETGYDTFPKHAEASIAWCKNHNIELSDIERDLILCHDKALNWANDHQLRILMNRHGSKFKIKLINVILFNVMAKNNPRDNVEGLCDIACEFDPK